MKLKGVGILILTISFVMIITGAVSSFVISLKEDREKTQARMVVVNDSYEDFNTSVSLFETERDTLYTTSLGNLYYDTLATDDAVLKTKLSNFESIVDEITKKVENMDQLCRDVYYPDSSVNSKCSNYKSIYEQVINYFVGDVGLYNNTIKMYNEQQTAAGSTTLLEEYKTKKDYIDYNNDKEFEGKEVE